MRSLSLARLQLRRPSGHPLLVAALCAIVVVPLLYAALYLWAFWDPYGRLDRLPVGFVDLDAPALSGSGADSTTVTAGADLARELLADKTVAWHFYRTSAEASAALADGTVYLAVTVPRDFSARVASAGGVHPTTARLGVTYEESRNMLASQIGKRVMGELRATVSARIARGYADQVLSSFVTVHDGMVQAGDGASALSTGLASARAGSARIADGLSSAQAGTVTLASGMTRLRTGATALSAGASKVSAGNATLAESLGRAATGSRTVATGASGLAAGAGTLGSKLGDAAEGAGELVAGARSAQTGAGDLADGLSRLDGSGSRVTSASGRLTEGLSTLDSKSSVLKDGASNVQAGAKAVAERAGQAACKTQDAASAAADVEGAADAAVSALQDLAESDPAVKDTAAFHRALACAQGAAQGADSLHDGLSAAEGDAGSLAEGARRVAAGAGSLVDGIDSYVGGVASAAAGSARLTQGLDGYAAGLAQAADGAASLAGGSRRLAAGTQTLATGLEAADQGASTLASGASRVAAGTRTLSSGTGLAAAGARTLSAGSTDLASGAAALEAGTVVAVAGSRELESGTAALAQGADALHGGLMDAAVGSSTLARELTRGAADVPRDAALLRHRRAAVMSDPVKMVETRSDPVANYGTGFTPYFVPLALWVGAIVIFMLMKPASGRALTSGAPDIIVALAGWLPTAVLGIAQAVVLVAVLQLALGLRPSDPLATYGFAVMGALVATAILQTLSIWFGPAGKLGAIVLLMMQLTSSAGTFPAELIPSQLASVGRFLPMTYVVSGMRTAVSGGATPLWPAVLALAGFVAGALTLTTVAVSRKRVWTVASLHPVLEV